MTAKPEPKMEYGRFAHRGAAFGLIGIALGVATVACGPLPGAVTPSLPSAPTGARPLGTALPPSLRHFALSPDRRKVAFMEDVTTSPIGRLRVATLGGDSTQVADVGQGIEHLEWNARGDALYFGLKEERVIPGEFSDWDIPRTEVQAHRIMRVDVGGGEPRVVVEAKERLAFTLPDRADVLVYQRETAVNGSAELVALDLASGASSKLVEGGVVTGFDVAPDGAAVAYGMVDLQGDGVPALSVITRPDGERIAIKTEGLAGFGWIDADRLVVVERVGEAGQTMRLRTVSKAGVQLASVDVEGNGGAYAPGIGTAGGMTSPDGKWVLAAGKVEGLQVISLDTGRVYSSPYRGWEGWLDAETLIGTFQGGLFSMPLAAAFDLTTPAPTGAAGK